MTEPTKEPKYGIRQLAEGKVTFDTKAVGFSDLTESERAMFIQASLKEFAVARFSKIVTSLVGAFFTLGLLGLFGFWFIHNVVLAGR